MTQPKFILSFGTVVEDTCDHLQRYGRFKIHTDFLKHNHLPDSLFNAITSVIFGNVFITRAESSILENVIYYEGYSKFFDVLTEGSEIPWYNITLSEICDPTTMNKSLTLEVIRSDTSCHASLVNWQ